MRTYKLFSAGLGLLFSSPEPLRELIKGGNYTGYEDDDTNISGLFRNQEMFLLATGSPELDYEINVYDGGISQEIEDNFRASIQVCIDIRGGAMVIRDGYDLMDWNPTDKSTVQIAIDDGYYQLHIGWSPSPKHAEMVLHIHPQKTATKIPGEDMYEFNI